MTKKEMMETGFYHGIEKELISEAKFISSEKAKRDIENYRRLYTECIEKLCYESSLVGIEIPASAKEEVQIAYKVPEKANEARNFKYVKFITVSELRHRRPIYDRFKNFPEIMGSFENWQFMELVHMLWNEELKCFREYFYANILEYGTLIAKKEWYNACVCALPWEDFYEN